MEKTKKNLKKLRKFVIFITQHRLPEETFPICLSYRLRIKEEEESEVEEVEITRTNLDF